MRGNVIGFDPDTNTGAISGHDGTRYDFATQDWHGQSRPRHGDLVDFIPEGQRAGQIYLIEPEYVAPSLTQFLFSIRGRISRSQFWLKWFLPVVAIHLLLLLVILIGSLNDSAAVAGTFFVIWILFSLATIWPSTAVLVKRIHDRNKTGWLVLAYYIPTALHFLISVVGAGESPASTVLSVIEGVVGIWFFVEFGCLRGTVGVNRYGPDPVANPPG